MYLLTASLSKTKKKPNIKRQACLFVSQWCLATLISRIYETLLIGSEIKWGNLAAHKFELQALVALRVKKILAICFLGSEYFAQRLNEPLDENGKQKFGRN